MNPRSNTSSPGPDPSHSGGRASLSAPDLDAPICVACGTQFGSAPPPATCPICEDERQYVPRGGQAWTTLAALRASRRNELVPAEPGLTIVTTTPAFAIGHRAFLVEAPSGNVLWDCVSLVDDATVGAIRDRGGVRAIAVSHPHFYSTMVEWAHALDAPVFLHEADREWVMRPDPSLRFWSGASLELPGGTKLVHTGGHFPGSQVLHWPAGAGGKGVVLAGDDPSVCADAQWVTFMYSFPNYVPLSEAEAWKVTAALRPLAFDRLYGWIEGRILSSNAKAIVERSAERHARALRGEHGVVARVG